MLAFMLFALSFGFGAEAYAHKVNVFAYSEGDRVYVQGYFLDGRKAKNSKIVVYSDAGAVLAEGLTNEQGEFTFPAPRKQGGRIVLNAGEGHQAEYIFMASEFAGATSPQTPPAGAAASAEEHVLPTGGSEAAVQQEALRRAVAEGVLPLAKEIAELKERRAASDIIGGLGFIIGVLGLFAYFKASRKS